jgi:hypothetical protein
MLELIGLGLSFLQPFLASLSNKVPSEVEAAVQAAVTALANHQADLITQANLEAERG